MRNADNQNSVRRVLRGPVKTLASLYPTNTTAAIVVSRRCFISLQLSILHPSCRRVCGGGRRFHLAPNLAVFCHTSPSHSHPHLHRLAVRRFPFDLHRAGPRNSAQVAVSQFQISMLGAVEGNWTSEYLARDSLTEFNCCDIRILNKHYLSLPLI